MNADFEIRVQFETLLRSLLKLEDTRNYSCSLFFWSGKNRKGKADDFISLQ